MDSDPRYIVVPNYPQLAIEYGNIRNSIDKIGDWSERDPVMLLNDPDVIEAKHRFRQNPLFAARCLLGSTLPTITTDEALAEWLRKCTEILGDTVPRSAQELTIEHLMQEAINASTKLGIAYDQIYDIPPLAVQAGKEKVHQVLGVRKEDIDRQGDKPVPTIIPGLSVDVKEPALVTGDNIKSANLKFSLTHPLTIASARRAAISQLQSVNVPPKAV